LFDLGAESPPDVNLADLDLRNDQFDALLPTPSASRYFDTQMSFGTSRDSVSDLIRGPGPGRYGVGIDKRVTEGSFLGVNWAPRVLVLGLVAAVVSLFMLVVSLKSIAPVSITSIAAESLSRSEVPRRQSMPTRSRNQLYELPQQKSHPSQAPPDIDSLIAPPDTSEQVQNSGHDTRLTDMQVANQLPPILDSPADREAALRFPMITEVSALQDNGNDDGISCISVPRSYLRKLIKKLASFKEILREKETQNQRLNDDLNRAWTTASRLSVESQRVSQFNEETKNIARGKLQHVKAVIAGKDTIISSLKEQARKDSARIHSFEAELASVKNTTRDKEIQKQRMHDELAQAQATTGQLSAKIQKLSQAHEKMKRTARGELTDVSAKIAEKDTEISSLKDQIAEDSSTIHSLEADLEQLSAIWKTIDRSAESIHGYEREIRLKSRLVDELRHQVTQLTTLASRATTVIQSADLAQNLDAEVKLMDKKFAKPSIVRIDRES